MDLFGINLWPDRSVEDDEFPEQRRRRWLWVVAAVVLGAAAVALGPSAQPTYRRFRAERCLLHARTSMKTGDFATARIQLASALRFDGSRADLHEAMADALRAEGSPRRAVELAQAAALATNRPDIALLAAQSCVENDRTGTLVPLVPKFLGTHAANAALWYWCGLALLREDHTPEGNATLARSALLAPEDSPLQLDIATRQIASRSPEVVAQGMGRLDALRRRPGFPLQEEATRALAAALLGTDPARALALWEEHMARHDATWKAKLSHLDALARANPEAVRSRLDVLWQESRDPTAKADLLSRIAKWGGPEAAQAWMDRLPASDRSAPPVLVSRIELLAAAQRWKDIAGTIDAAIESRTPYNVADQITLWSWQAAARRALDNPSGAQAAIRAVETLVGSNATAAVEAADWMLAHNFDFEAAALFRTASRPNSPVRYRALSGLNAICERQGDLQKQLQASEQLLQLDEDNPEIKRNLAAVMLELGWDRPRALKSAREAWEQRRESWEFTDTFARALARNEQAVDGAALYERMPPAVLARDPIRLNYAETLMAAGRFADARLQLNQVRQDQLNRTLQSRRERLEIELRAR